MNGLTRVTTLVTTLALVIASAAIAGELTYTLPWHTSDSGGTNDCTGGDYVLAGTAGQLDAGPALSGGGYVLHGGFWTVGSEGTCPWDLDGSGSVDTVDFLDLLGQWGQPGPADFDGSGAVDTPDFLALLANWGPCP